MIKEVFEETWIIDYELVQYGSVNVLTWEFILVSFFYYLRHLCEVSRDIWSILLYYQIVMTNDIL